MNLARAPIHIPPVWAKDWSTALEKAGAIERPLLAVQHAVVKELQRIDGTAARPELLGWLVVATRLFGVCEMARAAIEHASTFGLRTLARQFQDITFHLELIARPVLSGRADASAPALWSQVVHNLRAYTAWCIAWDIFRLQKQRRGEVLDRAFDAEPTRRLLHSLGEDRTSWEAMFGEIEVHSEAELLSDRIATERNLDDRLGLLRGYMSDPLLAPWTSVSGDRSPGEFYALLGVAKGNTIHAYRELEGEPVSYEVGYRTGSAALHGSSMEQFVTCRADGFMPKLAAPHEMLQHDVEPLIEHARIAYVTLWVVRRYALIVEGGENGVAE